MNKFKSVRELLEKLKSLTYLSTNITGMIDKSEDEILNECIKLQEEGLLIPKYEVRCPACYKMLKIYETFNQIEEVLECNHCGKEYEIDVMNDSRVLFYVIH